MVKKKAVKKKVVKKSGSPAVQLLVFHEKNGDRHFAFSTDEERNRAAQKVVLERLEDGYWYPSAEQHEQDKPEPPIRPANYDNLSDALKRKYEQEERDYRHHFARWSDDGDLIKLLSQVREKPAAAWKVIQMREEYEYEYEGYSIETTEAY